MAVARSAMVKPPSRKLRRDEGCGGAPNISSFDNSGCQKRHKEIFASRDRIAHKRRRIALMTAATLGCEHARSRTLQVRGLRLHFLEWGTAGAPALCFLHGGAAHAHWFDRVTPEFTDRFHVLALDQRGHGESEWAEPPAYGTEDFTGDLLALMDTLGLARMAVIGHSMGGHNAMTFAAWHPARVSALVIIDSRPAIPSERLQVMHARGRRLPRAHLSEEAAVQAFRLLPRETVADPAFLAHLARA